jgi:hypothetical protein
MKREEVFHRQYLQTNLWSGRWGPGYLNGAMRKKAARSRPFLSSDNYRRAAHRDLVRRSEGFQDCVAHTTGGQIVYKNGL